jgi:hypothetical protein
MAEYGKIRSERKKTQLREKFLSRIKTKKFRGKNLPGERKNLPLKANRARKQFRALPEPTKQILSDSGNAIRVSRRSLQSPPCRL